MCAEGGRRRTRGGKIRRIQSKRREEGDRGVTEWDSEAEEEGGGGEGRIRKQEVPLSCELQGESEI